MNSNRSGKIAFLPHSVQEELNQRLAQNTPGRLLLPWLNSLEEVQAILKASFNNRPVSEQNLSNWRRGGYLEWQTRQHLLNKFRELSHDAAAIEESLGSLTDHAARLLAFHFSQILCPSNFIHGRPAAPKLGNSAIKLLCAISRAISSLRRGDQAATRLKLQQQKQNQNQQQPEPPSTFLPPGHLDCGSLLPLWGRAVGRGAEPPPAPVNLPSSIGNYLSSISIPPPPPTPPRPIKAFQAISSHSKDAKSACIAQIFPAASEADAARHSDVESLPTSPPAPIIRTPANPTPSDNRWHFRLFPGPGRPRPNQGKSR